MKRNLFSSGLVLILTFCISLAIAQAPQQVNYQAVVRDNNGNALVSTAVQMRFTIHDSLVNGTAIFTETQSATTNAHGLVSLQIGSVQNLAPVNWSSGSKFLQIELSSNGGTTFTDMGTSQLVSVPYALHAETSGDNNWLKDGNNIYNANTGNVGIGESSPNYSLEISDAQEITASVKSSNVIGAQLMLDATAPGGGQWRLVSTANGAFADPGSLGFFNSSTGYQMVVKDNGNVGIGTTAPAVSAALEVSSTTKGFLPPRLSTTERDAISTPAEGLIIYNTTLKVPQYFDGIYWHNMNGTHFVGEHFGGGIVFYTDPDGLHGLVVTDYDVSVNTTWGCHGTLIGGTGSAVGSGAANTNAIVAGCATTGIAAELCSSLIAGGYSDWYLPSVDELSLLYNNNAVVGLGANAFWSSTEYNLYSAYYVHFSNGAQLCCPSFGKNQTFFFVRAVRSF